MSELLARLRIMQEPPMVPPDVVCWDIICRTFKDAADEIERLRADQAHAVEAMLKQAQTIKSQAARLAEAERLLEQHK